MKSFAQKVRHFLKSEDGPTAVEYAVMLALIIVVAMATVTSVGEGARDMFQTVGDKLAGAQAGGGTGSGS